MKRRSRTSIAAAILVIGLSIAGCSATPTGLDTETSRTWQARVVAIAEYAGATDHATALQELDALETEAARARADGEISAERASIIQQSIALVRADLEAAIAATTPPAPDDTTVTDSDDAEQETTSDDDSDDKGDKGDKPDKPDKKPDDEKGENKGKGDAG